MECQGQATGRLSDQHRVLLQALLTCLLLAEQRDREVPPGDLKPQAVATTEERKAPKMLFSQAELPGDAALQPMSAEGLSICELLSYIGKQWVASRPCLGHC